MSPSITDRSSLASMELQCTHRTRKEHPMLSKEKQMDVPEVYDLTKSCGTPPS